MKIKIYRPVVCGKNATIGKMYVEDEFFCYTLEDVDRHVEDGGYKIAGKTCIPRGIYQVVIDFSNHFGKNLPHVLNVPGFEGIRIHPGNSDEDTEGCILVGDAILNDNYITSSRLAFDRLFDRITEAVQHEIVTLEIV